MGIANSHQISRYYDFFRDKEIVFTKANLQILKIDPRQIYIKCNGGQWPCLINSSSLQSAKIIIGTNSGAYLAMTKDKNIPVSLRYCFLDANNSPIHLFVNCTITEINKYQNTDELAVVSLNFSQQPPDDLIMKIGEFLEASQNFYNRKEERIDINKNTIRKLGLEKEESVIFVENVPRRCILKDLSFSGAKVMLVGVPKFLVGKTIGLKIDFIDTNESVLISGMIPRAEFLEGRQDICAVHISFNGDLVPMVYKIHINSYITTYQKTILNGQNQDGADKKNNKQAESEADKNQNQQNNNTDKQENTNNENPANENSDENKVSASENNAPAENNAPVENNTENQEQQKTEPVDTNTAVTDNSAATNNAAPENSSTPAEITNA